MSHIIAPSGVVDEASRRIEEMRLRLSVAFAARQRRERLMRCGCLLGLGLFALLILTLLAFIAWSCGRRGPRVEENNSSGVKELRRGAGVTRALGPARANHASAYRGLPTDSGALALAAVRRGALVYERGAAPSYARVAVNILSDWAGFAGEANPLARAGVARSRARSTERRVLVSVRSITDSSAAVRGGVMQVLRAPKVAPSMKSISAHAFRGLVSVFSTRVLPAEIYRGCRRRGHHF
jgi:hypothetical protein